MSMGGSSTGAGASVDGIKPVPTQTLATATWQGMKVQARAMTAVPFVIYDGTSERMVKPGKNTAFHLMVDLNDSRTGVAIPYAGVWATIKRGGKLVYDERLWPMISEYMGPHYGNDVSLPGKGTYQLSMLISPPVSARHVEYQNVWLHPHRVTTSFTWRGAA
ncbi:MAG TPA: iron transporter [Solirubrobacteraceae bacterium]|nr:iron transporter [Solirubrobacteraceae bacterium]